MIEKFCRFLVTKMRNEMPEMDDERAEIILYGIQLILGEIPKVIILFGLGFLLGIGWYIVFAYIALIPYRASSGGFHLKSHLGCIIGTNLYFQGIVLISRFFSFNMLQKSIIVLITFFLGIIMITLYAPADTENLPIISKKERKQKKLLSYVTLVLTLCAGMLIRDSIISNILIFGVLFQTVMISRIAYKLTNNKYGHEVYKQEVKITN